MGKTVGELHAMLNEYKKGLPKKAETLQVMMIKGGKIQKANKKSLKAKGKNKVNGKGKDKEDYALESATCILNMVPTKKVDKTPYELRYGKVPNLSYLKVWGCEALVKRDTPDKLEQRSVKCIFIGYPKETMGLLISTSAPENKNCCSAMLDLESNKWIDAMNAEIQSMMDNMANLGWGPELRVNCYCNTGFEIDIDDMKSLTGYVSF
ncbi:hypothetical protein Tco_0527257 [Tanacetum coccineum]